MKIAASFLFICVFVSFSDALRKTGPCSYQSTCSKDKYACSNGKCIDRRYYCNGGNHCGDNSDEDPCKKYPNCPPSFVKCRYYQRCIPDVWICDGYNDCNYEDERNCDQWIPTGNFRSANISAIRWLNGTNQEASRVGLFNAKAQKSAVAMYLTLPGFSRRDSLERKTFAYESSIQLLALLNRKKLQDLPAAEIASFVNAFLVTCIDPRSFFSMDLISELRSRIKAQSYTVPYVYLTLCNAGEMITEEDVTALTVAFWNGHYEIWTSTRAMILMALACAKEQSGSTVTESLLQELAFEIKQKQYRNGTVENLKTTALVMQALYASESEADPDNFDEDKAIAQILGAQLPDGSFGSLADTYYVLPVLSCSSLVNISNSHCPSPIEAIDPTGQNLINVSGPKVRVKYSLWIGEFRDVEKILSLRVPTNSSFYKVMEIAADIDYQYRFEYVMSMKKPYITAISGIQNDPEGEYFWFPYILEGNVTIPIKSPADVFPKQHDHMVMWYKQGKWTRGINPSDDNELPTTISSK